MNNYQKGLLSALFLGAFNPFAQAKRPNVIFILTDDQNTNTVGCYEGLVKTPNIDNLAKTGIKFTNANVVSSVCSPSRYNILTGRYYNHSYSKEFLDMYPLGKPSCINNFMVLEDDNMNVASILRDNGYTTGFVGKFHLADHFLLGSNNQWEANGLKTYPKDSDPRTDAETNEKMKFNHQVWCNRISKFGFDYVNGVYAANLRELFNDYLNTHNVEWTIDAAMKFIDMQASKKTPFFLYVATTYPHGPAPEQKVDGKFQNSLDNDIRLTGEGFVDNPFNVMPSRESVKERFQKLKEENPNLPNNAITAIWWDDAVGAIMKKLKETGLDKNTLIIFTSDNGVLNGGKTTLYENGVHLPLIMNWKEGIKSGLEYDHVVASIDYVPTILDVCQAKIPEKMKMDGVSLKHVLKGDNAPVRDALLLEMGYARGIKTDSYKYIAVRYPEKIEQEIKEGKTFGKDHLKQPYLMLHEQLASMAAKANRFYFDRNQVFDLQNDPHETKNIYGENSLSDKQLQELLSRELKKFPYRPFGEFNTLK
ncbi:MAG: sulfatase-like hydrolase/transferase [Bacteroidia bacterium]|nr:sulfatase-like hydrolase/transferase [Bacteroidia bacterium]